MNLKLFVPCSEVYTKVSNARPSWDFMMATAERKDTWIDGNKIVVEFRTREEYDQAAENLRLRGFTVERGV